MITYPKYLDRSQPPVVRLIGLGNAGVNLADRISMNQGLDLETVVINSDQQSLSSSVSGSKVALGPLTTRGLGAGGDPEIGLDAAKESLADIETALLGADIVFLCAGLGGGTASGAAGMVAEAAKKAGALLVAIVTSPFGFEGRRRAVQAAAALREVSTHADAVIHFENDRMAELSAPRSGVSETFSACDELLGGCVEAVTRLVSAPGPMGVGLQDLLAVLDGGEGACLFGTGVAVGDNRAHEALEDALKSPLLDRGRLLEGAASVLVHISGPPSLSFAEVGAIMQEVTRQVSESALMHLGVSTSPDREAPLCVSIIAKCGVKRQRDEEAPARPARLPASQIPATPRPQPAARPPVEETRAEELIAQVPAAEPQKERPAPAAEVPPAPRSAPSSAPRSRPPQPEPKPAAPKIKQETLQFEPIARGRFEKIEPTIVEGEDLDVPTFLRMTGKRP